MITFKLYGDWNRIQRGLEAAPVAVAASAIWGQRKAAEKLVKIVKDHINNQDLGWPARSPTTNSNDPRTLVDREEYYAAIKAWKDHDVYFVGVKKSAYSSKGVQIAKVAAYHEYGTNHEPARPLWRPSKKELGGQKAVAKIILTQIYKKVSYLRSQGFEIDLQL